MVKNLEDKLLKEIEKQGLSEKEVKILLNSVRQKNKDVRTVYHPFSNKKTRLMLVSDTHIGHKAFRKDLYDKFVSATKRFKPDAIYHVGDILEGMSGRPGHVYELSHIGFQQQIRYAADLFNLIDNVPIYGITGNHDDWYAKKNNGGVIVGEELEQRVKGFTFLGQNEADIMLTNKTKLKLFHPNDGSAYALSYKIQKLIESFTGGDKPDIVAEGHYHKALYMVTRNVHGFESGTLCDQTPFMRLKKLPAHMGFWMLDVYFGKDKRIQRITPTFFPHYN